MPVLQVDAQLQVSLRDWLGALRGRHVAASVLSPSSPLFSAAPLVSVPFPRSGLPCPDFLAYSHNKLSLFRSFSLKFNIYILLSLTKGNINLIYIGIIRSKGFPLLTLFFILSKSLSD